MVNEIIQSLIFAWSPKRFICSFKRFMQTFSVTEEVSINSSKSVKAE